MLVVYRRFSKLFTSLKQASMENKLINTKSYEDTIVALNGLITNSSILNKSVVKGPELRLRHIPETIKICERAGLNLSDINRLNTIHVAGTKGKGSTSTYIDGILRCNGYKTGLFTSPHLKEVRERIKINGDSVSISMFNNHFWKIYDNLVATKTCENEMPFYFQFLTIMALDIFLKEQVDFVILEAGIGGRFDTTNIISNPKIACITSIGFDHMEILGNTLSEIAWNKAGIIKPNCSVVTCSNQKPEVTKIILQSVLDLNATLYIVPIMKSDHKEDDNDQNNKLSSKLDFFDINGNDNNKGNSKQCGILRENISLATSVCRILLNKDQISLLPSKNHVVELPIDVTLPDNNIISAIINSNIPGRYQMIKRKNINYYIDGAHTVESIKTAVNWFQLMNDEKSENDSKRHITSKRFLVFMITGKRNADLLLAELIHLKFDGILLTPLIPCKVDCTAVQSDFAATQKSKMNDEAKMSEIAVSWRRAKLYNKQRHYVNENDTDNITNTQQKNDIHFFDCFTELRDWVDQQSTETTEPISVFVVGSLHLVGCALSVLE